MYLTVYLKVLAKTSNALGSVCPGSSELDMSCRVFWRRDGFRAFAYDLTISFGFSDEFRVLIFFRSLCTRVDLIQWLIQTRHLEERAIVLYRNLSTSYVFL